MDPREPGMPASLLLPTRLEHLFDVFNRAQADELISSGRNVRRGTCYGRFVDRVVRNLGAGNARFDPPATPAPGRIELQFEMGKDAQQQQTLTSQARGSRQPIIGGILIRYHDGTPGLGMR